MTETEGGKSVSDMDMQQSKALSVLEKIRVCWRVIDENSK